MRRINIGAAIAILIVGLNAQAFAAPKSPIQISQCENITRPGNYVLANDLELDASDGNCLVISASNVQINLGGLTISSPCDPYSFCPSGGIGIAIASGANQVSISNGSVEGFVYGIVAEGNRVTGTNLNLTAVVGITLNGSSNSIFTNITYEGADTEYHGTNGPILYLEGGGQNMFRNVSGEVGCDLGGPDGIEVVNSNGNLISGVTLENTSCGGTDILLSDNSSSNMIMNTDLFDDCGGGIGIEAGSGHNMIIGNNVTVASPADVYAMFDENPNCQKDIWMGNTFNNIFDTGEVSASPASCIH